MQACAAGYALFNYSETAVRQINDPRPDGRQV
jgi:hypothetical protein